MCGCPIGTEPGPQYAPPEVYGSSIYPQPICGTTNTMKLVVYDRDVLVGRPPNGDIIDFRRNKRRLNQIHRLHGQVLCFELDRVLTHASSLQPVEPTLEN